MDSIRQYVRAAQRAHGAYGAYVEAVRRARQAAVGERAAAQAVERQAYAEYQAASRVAFALYRLLTSVGASIGGV